MGAKTLPYQSAIFELEKRGYKVEKRLGGGGCKVAYRVVDNNDRTKQFCVRFSFNTSTVGHLNEVKTSNKMREVFGKEKAERVTLETFDCFQFTLPGGCCSNPKVSDDGKTCKPTVKNTKPHTLYLRKWVAEIQPIVATEENDPDGIIAQMGKAAHRTVSKQWDHLREELWQAVVDLGLCHHSDDIKTDHQGCDQLGVPANKKYATYLDVDEKWLAQLETIERQREN